MDNPYAIHARPVSQADVNTRADFILKTYAHLVVALCAFTLLEVVLFQTGVAEQFGTFVLTRVPWLGVLAAFMVVMWLGSRLAASAQSRAAQYLGLITVVCAEALIFTPMLWIAYVQAPPGTIQSAAVVSLVGFAGLTAVAFLTRKDFSFLRGLMFWGGICALALIVGGAIFGFHMGLWFSVAMVALAGGGILYDTSNVLHHYPEDRYVAASLQLFASVALLFWYVLRIFMSRD